MKNASFKVKIESPCQENWEKMHSNNSGKFCDACQKNVVDFTNKTPREIALALNNSSEKTCGRFTKTQLEQIYSVVATPKLETNWYHNIAASFLVMLGVKNASAQGSDLRPNVNTELIKDSIVLSPIKSDSVVTRIKVTGKLLKKGENSKLSNVRVYPDFCPEINIITDLHGNFSFYLDAAILEREQQVIIRFFKIYDQQVDTTMFFKQFTLENGSINLGIIFLDVTLEEEQFMQGFVGTRSVKSDSKHSEIKR